MNTIKITNSSSSFIRFSLTYFLNGRLVSKTTPNFSFGHIGQLDLPDNASSITITVSIFICGTRYKLIYSESIYDSQSICYIARGSAEFAFCQKIPCYNLYNPFY